ncbi:hydrogenase maturation nickel metallochaperone HypA/HybF [Gelatiniphilus marinus]|uniref:Hydrogenase maturation nickel metallochaperone HypA n=1 Tax=Gelatiniphilus marinus TaxID=1759464 RepID=A0ABW5JRS1_9FLAO
MHEIYLIRSTFERIEEEFPEKFERVSEIHLKVGLLSNVQPILITNAFKAFVMEFPQYYNTKLIVDTLPVIIECKCGERTEVEKNRFVCASCNSPCRNIVQGEELYINEINFKNENEYNEA